MPSILWAALAASFLLCAACGDRDDAPPSSPTPYDASTGKKDVWLVSIDPAKKIALVALVRSTTGLGLKDAKDLVESAPKLVKSASDRAEAEALAKSLRDAGGTVEIR